MGRRALIEALSGAPVGPGRAYAAVGLDPEGAQRLVREKNIERAKKKAHHEGTSRSATERIGDAVDWNAQDGLSVDLTALSRDPANDPQIARAPESLSPIGASVERRTQQREELTGEKVPGYAKSFNRGTTKLPGFSPMIDDAGAFSGRGAAINAISAALMLAAAPAGPGAAGAAAGEEAAAAGATAVEQQAAIEAAKAAAGTAPIYQAAGTVGGSYAPDVLSGGASRNPYSRAGVSAGASLGTALLQPSVAVPRAADFGIAGDVLNAPGSIVPEASRRAIGSAGRSVLDALPTVASTSQDVLGALQSQRRSRFRALMRGSQQAIGNRVTDPFGLIPDVGLQ